MLLHTPEDPRDPKSTDAGHAKILMVLRNKVGLHSRPVGAFVRVSKKFRSTIRVGSGDQEVDGKSILGLLSLDAGQNALISIEAVGEDAHEAVRALEALIREGFGEIE